MTSPFLAAVRVVSETDWALFGMDRHWSYQISQIEEEELEAIASVPSVAEIYLPRNHFSVIFEWRRIKT